MAISCDCKTYHFHNHILRHRFQVGKAHKHFGAYPGWQAGKQYSGLIGHHMPQNKSQGLRVFVAQYLSQNTGRYVAKFPKWRGAKLQVKFINNVLGSVAIKVFEQQFLNCILAARDNILAGNKGVVKLSQNFFH
jgi:hypothetical protein